MSDLKNYDLERKALDMLDEFGGYEDSEILFNVLNLDGTKLQFKLMLVAEDEPEFSDYDEAPEFTRHGNELKQV